MNNILNSLLKQLLSTDTDIAIHRLGYGGLFPFVFLALLLWMVKPQLHPFVAIALTSYGAAIVSFLGGIHWGLGFRLFSQNPELARFHFIWGVIPSILGWIALIMPAYAALPLLGLILVACYLVDRKTWPAAGASHWLKLRFRLTVVATLSCLLAAAAT